jgi:RND family efflux transporter MFP subunit
MLQSFLFRSWDLPAPLASGCRSAFAGAIPLVFMLVISSVIEAQDAEPVTVIKGAQVTLIREVDVATGEAGLVADVLVRPGQMIHAGDLLGQLDDTDAKLAAEQAEIELATARDIAGNDIEVRAAKKSQQVAQAELARGLEAIRQYSKAISQTEIDRLRLTVDRAVLAIEQSENQRRLAAFDVRLKEARLKQAQQRVNRHSIRSPLTGVVMKSNRDPGEWVETGTPVFQINQLDRLQCEGRADASLVDLSMVGQPVEISVYLSKDRTVIVDGKLVFVEPKVNAIKQDILIQAEFENPSLQILPGFKADIRLNGTPALASGDR